jgi:hypothetical protein
MTRDNYLFRRTSIFNILERQKRAVKNAVENLDVAYLLNTSEHDLIVALVDEFRLGSGGEPQ